MNNKLLSTTQLAKILGISREAVFKKIKSGEVPAKKIGRNYAINTKDLSDIFGEELSSERKKQIELSVDKVIDEYGETLELLGKE